MTDITSLGTQLQFITLAVVTIALTIPTVIMGLLWWRSRDAWSGWGVAVIITGIFAVLSAAIWAIAAIPYDSKYWGLYSVTGTVASVSNGIADGGDITYRTYIVQFDGDDRPYRFDDARIVTLEGQEIEALCTIGWVYMAADKWDCEIRSAGFVN